jgi:hypothetical protein
MAARKTKKHPKPARVRPKTGVGKAKYNKKLDISAGYVAAQAQNDTANKLQPQAQRLVSVRTNLTALLGKRVQLQQEKNANDAAVVVAVVEHDQATNDYAQEAAIVAAGDRSVLATYGVAAAADGVRGANDQVGVTSKLTVLPGAVSGEARLRCKKVPHAGAYLFEYKLEPSQPTDPWLPQGGILTTHVETTVGGLAPEQLLRGRVRAIGGVVGGWSEEVVGRAK